MSLNMQRKDEWRFSLSEPWKDLKKERKRAGDRSRAILATRSIIELCEIPG
jgi:hypothetical protein